MRLVITLAGLSLLPSLLVGQARPQGAPAKPEVKEWEVPYGAQTRPRDPYADAKGGVWFVGQSGNYIGYLDSGSGEFRRYEIDPGTNPHNIVLDPQGTPWFTGNRNGRLVKLDPTTGKITTYMIPDSTVRDPHTMIFDRNGIAWFTAQNSARVGRFDPKTGQFRFWETGPRSGPYGIVTDSKGRPWFDLFGTNRIGTIDPQTLELKTFTLPNDSTRPRRIVVTADDRVWFGDYRRGYLGQLDPATGAVVDYAMPSGRASLPYGMALDDRGYIWVAENGRAGVPAKLVAFDPRAKKFVEEVAVGEPGANTIRHMTFDPATRQIWFGTDQGAIGRIAVPRGPVVP